MDKVYPNPFNNDLNITLKVPLTNDSILQIFDINGKQVSKIELRKETQLIKFNNNYLSKGLYFIKLSNGTNYDIIKVIKN